MTSMPPSPPPAPPAPEPPGGWAYPSPPSPPVRPSLRRSRNDKVLSGVCGGLAEYTGVDALLWRVGAIALTLAGGSGILVYVLLWLLMPRATADSSAVPGTPAPAAVRPAGPRSPVPGITVAALLLVAGVAVLIAQLTDWDLGARGFFATALLVVGIGLSVAAVTGAGRAAKGGLIGIGVVLALAAAISTTADVSPGDVDHVGDRTFVPGTAADVQPVYHGGVGDLTIDLGGIDLAGQTAPVVTRIDVGIGDVDVRVPPDADVRVTVDSGIGDVEVFGEDNASGLFAGNGTRPWSGDGTADIELSVHAGVGDVEVSRG